MTLFDKNIMTWWETFSNNNFISRCNAIFISKYDNSNMLGKQ